MKRASVVPACVLVVLALAPWAPPLAAQTATVPAVLAGRWTYPHDVAHAQSIVLAATEPLLSGFPEIVRPLARDQVRSRVRIARSIEVALDGAAVRTVFRGDRNLTIATPLGVRSTITGSEGQPVEVSQSLRGGWLEQTFHGQEGGMRQLLSTEPDGRTLHLDISLESERLSAPIRFRLDYVRAPGS